MISGLGISSGIASAVRTASKARATMDSMARQIATGQRVSSVKDDGAAWARASAMRADKTTWQARQDVLTMVKVDMEVTHTVALQQREIWTQLGEVALQARAASVGSNTRRALQEEWNHLVASMASASGTTPMLPNATWNFSAWNSGIALSASDSFLSAGGNWLVHPDLDLLNYDDATLPVSVASFDLLNATATGLDDITATIRAVLGDSLGGGTYLHLRLTEGARDMQRADRLQALASNNIDRLDTAIGSLTDADMAKASTARANAETRQQLALSTVRQALDAYGTYAGGLLGNVQRTQRGILA